MARNKNVQYFTNKLVPVTKKEFLSRNDNEEIKDLYASKQVILRQKTFTKSELASYENKGLLTSILYKGQRYFKQEDIRNLIKDGSGPKKGDQTSLF